MSDVGEDCEGERNDVVSVHRCTSGAVGFAVGYGVHLPGGEGSYADAQLANWWWGLFEVAEERGSDHRVVSGEQRGCCFQGCIERGPVSSVVRRGT
ncbi:MAG TPA: hypothetical protein VES40_17475 [Ilumatobacteraceae bacterium]|nr:hypothetical protein [Ilumatobacteraceae bacterium]